jgi:hypothetical protein
MQHGLSKRQGGLSMIGFVFVAAVLASAGVVLAQAVPTFIEYQAVVKAVKRAAGSDSAPLARDAFDKSASIDEIHSISGKDLEIALENNKLVVSFAYTREIHLAGPAYLTLKYAGQSR